MIIYDLNNKSWNLQVTVSAGTSGAPGGSRLHTANCLKDKMIVYGGGTQSPVDSDIWILDVSQYPSLTWERQDVSNKGQGPGARMGKYIHALLCCKCIYSLLFRTHFCC